MTVATDVVVCRSSAEKYLREVWPAITRALKEHGIACELNLVSVLHDKPFARKLDTSLVLVALRRHAAKTPVVNWQNLILLRACMLPWSAQEGSHTALRLRRWRGP